MLLCNELMARIWKLEDPAFCMQTKTLWSPTSENTFPKKSAFEFESHKGLGKENFFFYPTNFETWSFLLAYSLIWSDGLATNF